MKRVLFTIQNSIKNYKKLRNTNKINSITDLTLDKLNNMGVEALILDVDGVLNSHGKTQPEIEAVTWLKQVQAGFNGKVYILSNNTFAERKLFLQSLGFLYIIEPQIKKPFPDGILSILQKSNIKPEKAVIVDDRYLTGILAGSIVGINTLLVNNPLVDYKNDLIKEMGFYFIRVLERILLGVTLNDVCGHRSLCKV